MKLSELFLQEAKVRGWPADEHELELRIEDWLDTKPKRERDSIQPKQNDALHVSMRGDAEFGEAFGPARSTNWLGITERAPSDLNPTLPFKMQLVSGAFSINGMKRLNTLEGSPKEVLGYVEIYSCPALMSLEHFPAKIAMDVTIDKCKNLKSLKGMPDTLRGNFTVSNTPIENFEGMPEHISGDVEFGVNSIKSLLGIGDHVKFIGGEMKIVKRNVESGGLGLVLIKGLTHVTPDKGLAKSPWEIINKYIGQPDKIFECQEELIEAGYEEFAQL